MKAKREKKPADYLNAWAADFETNNYEEDCRVWCWGMEHLHSGEYFRGKTIDEFIVRLIKNNVKTCYMHNLKFDGGFILSWLLTHGYKHSTGRFPSYFEFTTLIDHMRNFYTITIGARRHNLTFIDSLKIIPSPIESFPKMFNLKTTKGEIDYNLYRPKGYDPTDAEWDYLYRDVHLLAQGMGYIIERGNTKITAAGNAYKDLHIKIGSNWDRYFPRLNRELDAILRKAYKGGYCIVGPQAAGDVGGGIVLDKNSMYPSHMAGSLMPYALPVYFTGRYSPDNHYPLYFQRFRCAFHVKHGKLPTLQLKGTLGFNPVEYVKCSNGEIIDLCLTSVDLEIFMEHYEPEGPIDWIDGWKFQASTEIFQEFVHGWYEIKERATLEGNAGMRTLAKLMLNASYGKYAKRGETFSMVPYLDENGVVRYKPGDLEELDLEYIPVGCFITAWSRRDIIGWGQKLYSRLLYIDTDSLHLLGEEIPEGMEIDPSKLGAWDKEYSFVRGRYIRAKTYLEELEDGELVVKCAGLPSAAKSQVTWENFHPGAVYTGKLQHQTVRGGVILKPIEFSIKIDKKQNT